MAKFQSIQQFKGAHGITHIDVVRNPNSNKLFCSADNGSNYRAQQDIDGKAPMIFLIPETGDTDANNVALTADQVGPANACLVNYDPTKRAEPVFSL